MANTPLTTALAQGTHASRPAAASSNAGFLYYETDTKKLFQSTGSGWTQLAPAVDEVTTETTRAEAAEAAETSRAEAAEALLAPVDSPAFTTVITLPQHATVGAPVYAEGKLYYDTTLHKLMVGGASGWETVTSS